MVKHKEFRLFKVHSLGDVGNTIEYFAFFMLPAIILDIILFSAPLYYSFKLKNIVYFITATGITLILGLELYLYGSSLEAVVINKTDYFLINTFFLFFFFYKAIIQKSIKSWRI